MQHSVIAETDETVETSFLKLFILVKIIVIKK